MLRIYYLTIPDMVVKHIQRTLREKSESHNLALQKLGKLVVDEALSPNVFVMEQTNQFVGMNTILQNPLTKQDDFVFYFDRLAALLVERYVLRSSHSPTPLIFSTVGRLTLPRSSQPQ